MTFKNRNNYNPKILPRAGLQNLSHVHARKITCVARERCARCGVLFAPTVAYKGIAVGCNRIPLKHRVSFSHQPYIMLTILVAHTKLTKKKKIVTNCSISIVSIDFPTVASSSGGCRNRKCLGKCGSGNSTCFFRAVRW